MTGFRMNSPKSTFSRAPIVAFIVFLLVPGWSSPARASKRSGAREQAIRVAIRVLTAIIDNIEEVDGPSEVTPRGKSDIERVTIVFTFRMPRHVTGECAYNVFGCEVAGSKIEVEFDVDYLVHASIDVADIKVTTDAKNPSFYEVDLPEFCEVRTTVDKKSVRNKGYRMGKTRNPRWDSDNLERLIQRTYEKETKSGRERLPQGAQDNSSEDAGQGCGKIVATAISREESGRQTLMPKPAAASGSGCGFW